MKKLQQKLFVLILKLLPFNAFPMKNLFFRGYADKQITKPNNEPGFAAKHPLLSKFGVTTVLTGAAGAIASFLSGIIPGVEVVVSDPAALELAIDGLFAGAAVYATSNKPKAEKAS